MSYRHQLIQSVNSDAFGGQSAKQPIPEPDSGTQISGGFAGKSMVRIVQIRRGPKGQPSVAQQNIQ